MKPDGSAGVEGEKSTRTLPFSERLLQAEELSKDVPGKKPTSLSEDDSLFEDEDLFQEERTPILKSPQAGAVTSIAPPACVEYPADWSLKMSPFHLPAPLLLGCTAQSYRGGPGSYPAL